MWFNSKPKNRAFERRHVLDVKIARRQAVRQRVRVATLAARVSLGTLFAIYFLWRAGEWAMNRFIYENKAFAIHEIDIQTDGVHFARATAALGRGETGAESVRARFGAGETGSRTGSSHPNCRRRTRVAAYPSRFASSSGNPSRKSKITKLDEEGYAMLPLGAAATLHPSPGRRALAHHYGSKRERTTGGSPGGIAAGACRFEIPSSLRPLGHGAFGGHHPRGCERAGCSAGFHRPTK